MRKKRADLLLLEQGLAESRSMAQRLVMAGQVRADGQLVPKPSSLVQLDARLEVKAFPKYVSRGGVKLEAALNVFAPPIEAMLCADVGASTGGFTDCLLQHGAAKVYAIDVGRGQLHWKLRQDPRVVVMEKSNARHLGQLPEKLDLITVDVSFISLEMILPVVKSWLTEQGQIIALVKPQFEAGKREVDEGRGIIRKPETHRRVLEKILAFSMSIDLLPIGLIASPIKGPKGNVEFLLWLAQKHLAAPNPENLLSSALAMAKAISAK